MIQKIAGLIFLSSFILFEYVFSGYLAGVSVNAALYFEIFLIIASFIIFWKTIGFKLRLHFSYLIDCVVLFVAGFLANRLIIPLGLQSPINLDNGTILFFILVYAPIIEELIFRMVIWQSIQAWIRKPIVVIGLTAALFAFSHLNAYFFIEPEFKPFVLYQTGYTLALGLFLGVRLKQTGSILCSILFHFFFNLGFALSGF